jgi:hypothetical protein
MALKILLLDTIFKIIFHSLIYTFFFYIDIFRYTFYTLTPRDATTPLNAFSGSLSTSINEELEMLFATKSSLFAIKTSFKLKLETKFVPDPITIGEFSERFLLKIDDIGVD